MFPEILYLHSNFTNLYNEEAFSGESGEEQSGSNSFSNFLAKILLFKWKNNFIK